MPVPPEAVVPVDPPVMPDPPLVAPPMPDPLAEPPVTPDPPLAPPLMLPLGCLAGDPEVADPEPVAVG